MDFRKIAQFRALFVCLEQIYVLAESPSIHIFAHQYSDRLRKRQIK